MQTSLDALKARLLGVPPDLVRRQAIDEARRAGAREIGARPAAFLAAAVEQSRRNPILCTARALGALGAARRADETAHAQAALGLALVWWGSHADALAQLGPAVEALEAAGARHAALTARWHRVLCERRLQTQAGSLDALLSIAAEFKALGDPLSAHRCHLDVVLHVYRRDREEALRLLEEARGCFAGLALAVDEGYALLARAAMHALSGEYAPAFERLDAAQALFERAEAPALIGYAWYVRGNFFKRQLQSGPALRWLRAAEARARSLAHPYYRILALADITALQFERGRVLESLEAQQELQGLAAANQLQAVTAFSLLTAGNLEVERGELERAEENYRRARDAYVALGDEGNAAMCTLDLGIVARRQGRFSTALNLLGEALDVFEARGHIAGQMGTHHNMGLTYAAFGYAEPAIEHLERSVDISQQHGTPAWAARSAIALAGLLTERGDRQRAQHLLDWACAETRAGGVDVAAGQCEMLEGDLLLKEGRAADALARYRAADAQFEALGLRERAWGARVKIAAAHLAQGDAARAERELARLPAGKLPADLRWEVHRLRAQIAGAQDRAADALDAYLEALLQVREARRSLRQEHCAQQLALAQQTTYDEAFRLALALGEVQQALLVAELYGAQIAALRQGTREVQIDPRAMPGPLAQRLSAHVGREWTVLRYAYHLGQYWLFVLTPTGLDLHPVRLDAGARLALRLATSADDSFRRRAYLNGGSAQNGLSGELSQRLFEALLPAAVRERLHPDHTLIIVPAYRLHGLAFHALLCGGAPLVEMARVLYGQSLEQLDHLLMASPALPHPLQAGLVLSQSRFEQPGYLSLPYVRQEVEAVLGAARGGQHRAAEGLDLQALARGGRVGRLARYDWLHVATHAYVDPATGAFTGLLLGDGVLDLQDIRRWRLAARLVTLSACQTGLGRWHYGDEIAGLTQAFLQAGAQSVVATLWLVRDEHTAALMGDFYRRLSDGLAPVTALAEAQRAAQRAGVAPYYWAPFSAFGRP